MSIGGVLNLISGYEMAVVIVLFIFLK